MPRTRVATGDAGSGTGGINLAFTPALAAKKAHFVQGSRQSWRESDCSGMLLREMSVPPRYRSAVNNKSTPQVPRSMSDRLLPFAVQICSRIFNAAKFVGCSRGGEVMATEQHHDFAGIRRGAGRPGMQENRTKKRPAASSLLSRAPDVEASETCPLSAVAQDRGREGDRAVH